MNSKQQVTVLMVCLGNICRSPTAHGVFESLIAQQDLDSHILVDSAGTAAYHIGNPPDERSVVAARSRGYELSHLRARQVQPEDFYQFDYILAMDKENLRNLRKVQPQDASAQVRMFLEFGQTTVSEVPDPYYGGTAGFEQVLDLVENASTGLLMHIRKEWQL